MVNYERDDFQALLRCGGGAPSATGRGPLADAVYFDVLERGLRYDVLSSIDLALGACASVEAGSAAYGQGEQDVYVVARLHRACGVQDVGGGEGDKHPAFGDVDGRAAPATGGDELAPAQRVALLDQHLGGGVQEARRAGVAVSRHEVLRVLLEREHVGDDLGVGGYILARHHYADARLGQRRRHGHGSFVVGDARRKPIDHSRRRNRCDQAKQDK